MRSAERRVGQLDDASVIEHQPGVPVRAPWIVKPLDGPIIARRIVVMEHEPCARDGEWGLQNV
jgi:hypothetical protein